MASPLEDISELKITFPDGSERTYPAGVTGMEIAESISKSLAKDAFVVRVNGNDWDLSRAINADSEVAIIRKSDDDVLEFIRHDTAHLMAQAVKQLYPETQVTIGPSIEHGFYYDFAREKPFTPDDLEVIEQRMHELVDQNIPIEREVWDRDEAVKFFKDQGEDYKAEIIASIPQNEDVGLYRQGDFIDLCRGPHAPTTAKIGHAFKLMKVAGAYWRGDSNNEMLQRIYGTAWANEKQLKAHLLRLEEAEKRDHRKLGKELSLFHVQEEAPGNVFWHPHGWIIYRICEEYVREAKSAENYQEINTPQLVDRSLWEKSGHWEKFRDEMFILQSEDKIQCIKPMSCPCHIQIFKQGTKSYRDLPLRYAEFGHVHRNEPSGAMHGLMRVRAFTQDDAHVFCTKDKISEETKNFCHQLIKVYTDFGFDKISIKFSDRPEVKAGSDEIWDEAESALKQAVEDTGLKVTYNPGEGAFYGPKLEFVLTDAIGREWQCGTLQVDFIMPQRLEAYYTGEDGEKHHPVMLHQAVFGSLERFIGILIEHYAGRFPVWLAPTQVVVTTIISKSDNYAREIYNKLRALGIRCELDLRNEKINYKVREHSHAKVPYIFVVGEREETEKTVSIRKLGQKNQEIMDLQAALDRLVSEAERPHYKTD